MVTANRLLPPKAKKISSRQTPTPSKSLHTAATRVSISPDGGFFAGPSLVSLGASSKASQSIFPAKVRGMAATEVTEAGTMYRGNRPAR